MQTVALLKETREEILRIASRHGAYNVRVFGSMARGEALSDSDIDLLVELEPGRTLVDLGSLQVDLGEALGRSVDVLTENGLHWYIREQVLKEAVCL